MEEKLSVPRNITLCACAQARQGLSAVTVPLGECEGPVLGGFMWEPGSALRRAAAVPRLLGTEGTLTSKAREYRLCLTFVTFPHEILFENSGSVMVLLIIPVGGGR